MAATIDSLMESFPYPTIPPIQGRPTHQSLYELKKLLYENAASVPSELGGGGHGHLGIPMSAAAYNAVTGAPFNPPNNPGPLPQIPQGATQHVILATERAHKEELRIFQLARNVDAALKQQIQNAVPRMYIKALANRHTGFMGVSTRQILQHLTATYGILTPRQIIANGEAFRAPYDPTLPIEDLYERIDLAVETAADSGAPYTAPQIVQNGYQIMFNTGLFPDACREWKRRPAIEKTWPNFQTHFTEAVDEYSEANATAAEQGYAGNVEEELHDDPEEYARTAEALVNLTVATQEDRKMLADLTAINKSLVATIAAKDAEIAKLQARIAAKQQNKKTKPNEKRYCWTHGYNPYGVEHTSCNCRNPKKGHQKEATWDNTMGGNQRNKP